MVIDLTKIPVTGIRRINNPASDFARKTENLFISSSSDSYETSDKKNVVNVFNSIMKSTEGREKIISPKFNGCHGVGIYSDNKMFFAHFPIYMKNRMMCAISSALERFDKSKSAQVVLIMPVSKSGTTDNAFNEYVNLINESFNNNTKIECLTYPNRSKGATYTYIGVIENGVANNFIKKVNN